MSTEGYINHLPFEATSQEIRVLLCAYGMVETVALMTDRQTGQPCGFACVGMMNGANEAIAASTTRNSERNRLDVKYPAPWRQARPLQAR
jgi:RNA recognition motif-containing protein